VRRYSEPESTQRGCHDRGMQALVLGTAQWGTPYGVTNERGRLSDSDLAEIMAVAAEASIKAVDTAAGYGDAEVRLGPWAPELDITTKVKADSPLSMLDQTRESLNLLGVESVRTLLIHDWFALDPARAAAAAQELAGIRDLGIADEIGISGYEPTDLETALAHFDRLDAVQVPLSALDARLDRHPALADLIAEGTRIQARSIFLQGLLATPSTVNLGQHPDVVGFHAACVEAGVSPIEGALSAVRACTWVSEVVIGVTSGQELREITRAWHSPVTAATNFTASHDLALIDPRNWA
jgi:aryl-alcohol dehydrogenase-like predicted oxidoreductase